MTGKDLLQKLKETGTGENKLAVVRDVLASNQKADDRDVINALTREFGHDHGTVTKAIEIARDAWKPPEGPPLPSEVLPLPMPTQVVRPQSVVQPVRKNVQ